MSRVQLLAAATAASPLAATDDPPPRWDLTPLFPGLDAPEFTTALLAATTAIADLAASLDGVTAPPPVAASDQASDDEATTISHLLTRYNTALERVELLGAYLYALVTTDSKNDLAQARLSELQRLQVELEKLGTRFVTWVGAHDVEALIDRSPVAADHAFPLRQAKIAARHLMSPAEEALAAEMGLPGGTAWAKLHDTITSQITVRFEIDGESRDRPMSEIRNLAYSPDPTVRRGAYEAELVAWEGAAVPLAAAMNGIKGQVNLLTARRGWDDPLDEALFFNQIDRPTLDAMLTAARESFPDFRRYLRAQARALGHDRLAWWNLFAPIGVAARAWAWDDARAFLLDQFADYSPKMRDLAARSFAEHWIDAQPRPNKQGGAYCMWVGDGDSRILANYSPSYDAVSTLAHELGHAYHNLNERGLTPLQRDTPMTLAETASTFCETIVKEAALAHAGPEERRFIVEQGLQGACQIVVDIVSRFDFERSVFAARRERELSIVELNALMLDAQRGTYGDGLDPDHLHPYMWAVKGHYYSPTRSFYNFPYLFGLLFGLGLYARFRDAPDSFRARYDVLLAHTGRADAATLATGWGIDLRAPDFWRSSLAVIRADIDRFEAKVAAGEGSPMG